jgi:hypothetical protein
MPQRKGVEPFTRIFLVELVVDPGGRLTAHSLSTIGYRNNIDDLQLSPRISRLFVFGTREEYESAKDGATVLTDWGEFDWQNRKQGIIETLQFLGNEIHYSQS